MTRYLTSSGIGQSFVRASLMGILPYHFEKRSLDMAIATVFVGFFSSWLILPAPTSYLFNEYGFNLTMFMIAPLMLVHLIGVIIFSQEDKEIEVTDLPEQIPLCESLKQVLTDIKVFWYWYKCVYTICFFSSKLNHLIFSWFWSKCPDSNFGSICCMSYRYLKLSHSESESFKV